MAALWRSSCLHAHSTCLEHTRCTGSSRNGGMLPLYGSLRDGGMLPHIQTEFNVRSGRSYLIMGVFVLLLFSTLQFLWEFTKVLTYQARHRGTHGGTISV